MAFSFILNIVKDIMASCTKLINIKYYSDNHGNMAISTIKCPLLLDNPNDIFCKHHMDEAREGLQKHCQEYVAACNEAMYDTTNCTPVKLPEKIPRAIPKSFRRCIAITKTKTRCKLLRCDGSTFYCSMHSKMKEPKEVFTDEIKELLDHI